MTDENVPTTHAEDEDPESLAGDLVKPTGAEMLGPYDAEAYGVAADGQPVNAFGRTQAMNEGEHGEPDAVSG